jgi:hypothetical protein
VPSSALPTAAAFIGTFAGVAAVYIGVRYKSSGRVRTSDAEVLWDALTAELAAIRADNRRLATELGDLRRHLEA